MDHVHSADISNIHPQFQCAGRTTFAPGYDGKDRTSFMQDHDMQLAIQGRGAIVIDGVEYPMEKGDFITVFPGETFYIKAYGNTPFTRYFMHLDFYRDETLRLCTPTIGDNLSWPRLVRLNYDLDIRTKCAELVLKSYNEDSTAGMIADGELLALIGMVLVQHRQSGIETQAESIKCRRNILKAARFIMDNYTRHISVEEMAQVAELSTNYFASMFKVVVGRTPNDYLTDSRIKQAKRLMVETDRNIGEIASLTGFENIHYFSYLFKRREGITPTEFISRFSRDE